MSKYSTYTFDNSRFFMERTKNGVESGGMGWELITAKGYREYLQDIDPERSCLVVVDMQQGCIDGWGLQAEYYAQISEESARNAAIYTKRCNEIVIPNIIKLLKLFREKQMPILFLRLGEDRLPDVFERRPNETLLTKYSAGAFATCAIDNWLKEKGVVTTFFVGTDTCACVNATAHGANDQGYQTILIDDACMSCRPELHDATILVWRYKGYVKKTDEVLRDYPWQKWIDPGLLSTKQ